MRHTGKRAGAEFPQVCVALPVGAGEPPKRLVAWDKVNLAPGESKTVTVSVPPLHLAVFNSDRDAWEVLPGDYQVLVGGSSRETPLTATVKTGGQPVN